MPKNKKDRPLDTAVLLFAVKVVGMVALAFIVTLGIDIFHAVNSIFGYYAG